MGSSPIVGSNFSVEEEQLMYHAILSHEERVSLMQTLQDMADKPYYEVSLHTGIHPDILRHLVRYGVIAGDRSSCNIDDAQRVAERLERVRQMHAGNGILASEAKKYGFSSTTIYRWYDGGWVRSISGHGSYNAQLFDEGDIALASELANMIGRVPGRSVFPPKPRSGRPKKKR